MSSSRSSGRPVRRSVTAAAVLALMAPLLALVGLVASPAVAADNITFRAGASIAANQITHRVTIPSAVRETDALLLFVSSNKALGDVVATPTGWTRVGSRLDGTDLETILYSKVAVAADAGRSQAVDFTATVKATLTLLAYDGTATDNPIAAFASAAETTSRQDAHDTGRERRRSPARTSCPTGPTSPPTRSAGRFLPARPSAPMPSASGPVGSPRSPPT